jgi:hypothetical protein
MKIKKAIFASLFLCAAIISICFLVFGKPFVTVKTTPITGFGDVLIAKPMWGAKASTLVFSEPQKLPAEKLARRLAATGLVTTVVDSSELTRLFGSPTKQCLDAGHLAEAIQKLKREIAIPKDKPFFVSGIGQGALFPFIHAQQPGDAGTGNLSIGFSVELPISLRLCPTLLTTQKEQKQVLVSAPEIKGKWRSVWVDKPKGDTAIFIKEKLNTADTTIAEYDTPLDTLLANELNSSLGQDADAPPVPVIEIPAKNIGKTATLFYSGDGGWRDLDRSVAEEMAKLGSSVLGVDVLRYFWERRTPDQVAADLTATMNFFRSKWGVTSFVLAGFSFGADILPVVYNRLPEKDKASVPLLVFLALGNHADFEVHVAGWLGQNTHEIPLAQELAKMPKDKMLCIYGKDEKAKTGTACSSLENGAAKVIELPGGHHFDKDYPKLARLILDNYRQHGID